ncbi:iron complex transport system substrate-binding protein [Alkalithermobacter thermoalcaliphilus JW-YL-7 = DSM 7308]|uniref:ABC-type transporter, periplasmic subunit n=1 Tax=Alkalithermobacter thermoalcaliphilus JW-YL-7 = DSM 7308 TaxID=1121328 RepID=A0A150FU33_CLOPD|nr:ABC-type transporter, periplasmic subunit [[Clostridium] paradoxum JW-YL-7 = DSM 7308]SHL17744.1 iron complex transport system substrate-binding protein [[Clostridium] paradoxum JW-YL-7 = DSM 7308]
MKKILILFITISMVVFSGCQNESVVNEKDEPIRVVDFRGKEIVLEKEAKTIAAMLDSALTTLHMLGIKDEVVAVDKWTYDSPGFEYTKKIDERFEKGQVEAVTSNIEKIVSLKPDIVIIWAEHEDIKALENAGLKVYGVQINSFDQTFKMVEDLGKITGKNERAREIIEYTKSEIKKIEDIVKTINEEDKQRALFIWGPTFLDIAGGDSTGNDIIVSAGGINVAKDINLEHPIANIEQLISWNPDAIIMWYSKALSEDDVINSNQLKSIEAINTNRVYMLPNFFYCDLWTVKYQYSVKAVAKWLYPELFKDIDLEQEKQIMLEKLYNFKF